MRRIRANKTSAHKTKHAKNKVQRGKEQPANIFAILSTALFGGRTVSQHTHKVSNNPSLHGETVDGYRKKGRLQVNQEVCHCIIFHLSLSNLLLSFDTWCLLTCSHPFSSYFVEYSVGNKTQVVMNELKAWNLSPAAKLKKILPRSNQSWKTLYVSLILKKKIFTHGITVRWVWHPEVHHT